MTELLPRAGVYGIKTDAGAIDMNTAFREQMVRARSTRWLRTLALGLLLTGMTLPAMAELGGDISTLPADQAHMKAGLRITRSARFSVNELVSPAGTAVREYASPSGKIFAVAWQGPWIPDLRQLFGAYFDTFRQSLQTRRMRGAPVAINEPGLVVQSGGHMRWSFGRAYVPDLLPGDVRPEEIQ